MVSKTSVSSPLSFPSDFSDCISRQSIKLGFGAKMADVTTALCAGKKICFRITSKFDSKHQGKKYKQKIQWCTLCANIF